MKVQGIIIPPFSLCFSVEKNSSVGSNTISMIKLVLFHNPRLPLNQGVLVSQILIFGCKNSDQKETSDQKHWVCLRLCYWQLALAVSQNSNRMGAGREGVQCFVL